MKRLCDQNDASGGLALDEKLRSITDPADELLLKFDRLRASIQGRTAGPELEMLNQIAEDLMEITKQTYDVICGEYSVIRGEEPDELEEVIWDKLLKVARERNDNPCLKLLDVGTSYGRDIRYGSHVPGLEVIGIDNSDGFIRILEKLERDGSVPRGSFVKADMRDCSCFPDGYFDIVRYQASLHHLPVIGKGYMADQALCEGYRVLKDTGIIYLSVKRGEGLQMVDTREGLGKILHQFHTLESISALLNRNHFRIVESWTKPSSRGEHIVWICAIAEKM